MTSDERSNHGKAVRTIARRLTIEQWEYAAHYAALQNHHTMVDIPYQTVLTNLKERGFAECTAWPASKRKRGTPLVSNGKLYFVYPQGDHKTSIATLIIARYVFLRSYAIGGGTPPFAVVYVVTGPRWVEVKMSNAAQLVAHKVGHPIRAAGVRNGKKYVAVRMDWI